MTRSYLDLTKIVVPQSASSHDAGSVPSAMVEELSCSPPVVVASANAAKSVVNEPCFRLDFLTDLNPIPVVYPGESTVPSPSQFKANNINWGAVPATAPNAASAVQALLRDAHPQDNASIHFSDSGFGNLSNTATTTTDCKLSSVKASADSFSEMSKASAASLAASASSGSLFALNGNLNTMSLKSPCSSSNNLVPTVSSSSFLSHSTQPPFSPGVLPTHMETSMMTRPASENSHNNGSTSSPPRHLKKRLERNRESAKLSRRRRKQYLQELEEKVLSLSASMDSGRREHVRQALSSIQQAREVCLASADRDLFCSAAAPEFHSTKLDVYYQKLKNQLSRACTSEELRLVVDFEKEQIKSLVIPPHAKLILWITLQNEMFFRGGRASTDRLSAARIGEKLLTSGSDCIPPCDGFWPLLCHEIALSYDQEEKVRAFQRTLILNKMSWLESRHASHALVSTIQRFHECLKGVSFIVGKREQAILNVLTVEQRLRFLVWTQRRASLIAAAAATLRRDQTMVESVGVTSSYKAVHLYLLDRRLREVARKLPGIVSSVPKDCVKKLSRRPMFEPLANAGELMNKSDSGGKLSPCTSKTNLVNDSYDVMMEKAQVTPAAAWAAAAPLIAQVLGPIGIPYQRQPIVGRVAPSSNSGISTFAMMTANHVSPVSSYMGAPPPTVTLGISQQVTPVISNAASCAVAAAHPMTTSSSNSQLSGHKRELSVSKPFNSATAAPRGHEREISLLNGPFPTSWADDIFPGHFRTESKGQLQADQYLLQLADEEDWAIGGFDIEMSIN